MSFAETIDKCVLRACDEKGRCVGQAVGMGTPLVLMISLLRVDEAFRGCGIGGELLRRVENWGIERSIPRAMVVVASSIELSSFVRRHGYRRRCCLEGETVLYEKSIEKIRRSPTAESLPRISFDLKVEDEPVSRFPEDWFTDLP